MQRSKLRLTTCLSIDTLLLSHLDLETSRVDPTSTDTTETKTDSRIALLNVTDMHSICNVMIWDTVLSSAHEHLAFQYAYYVYKNPSAS